MMRLEPRGLVLVASLLGFGGAANAQEAPFEPPVPGPRISRPDRPPSGFAPLQDLAISAIGWYQTDVGPNSISRCPYEVSCSRFAMREVEGLGFLVGVAYFLDRFLYRENSDALLHYRQSVGRDGRLKLDDTLHRAP